MEAYTHVVSAVVQPTSLHWRQTVLKVDEWLTAQWLVNEKGQGSLIGPSNGRKGSLSPTISLVLWFNIDLIETDL